MQTYPFNGMIRFFSKTMVLPVITIGRVGTVGGVRRREDEGNSTPFRHPSNPNSLSGEDVCFVVRRMVIFMFVYLPFCFEIYLVSD